MTRLFIKLSASAWVAAIADGGGGGTGGKCLRVENLAAMEVKMFVEYMVSKESIHPAFDRVGSSAPFVGGGGGNVKAFWMWEAKLHCFDRGGFVDS